MTKIRDDIFLEDLGKRILRLRLESKYSQYKLADLANINRSQIIGIERGKINPSICTLKCVSDAFEITLSELLENISSPSK